MSYILLTTPLVLHADPVLPSHAVTRQYVDAKRLNVNASWFTTGTISAARMPALGGDISSVAGSGTISLNVNGVTASTYTKVTVDATGRVTAGGALVSADIASVSWAKITSGKPTTAAGYGITNLISLSGGTASDNVSSTAIPSASLHAVTKGYVDNAISGVVNASLSSGDVIRKPVAIAPSGFLRCNGGIVSRAAYASLFSVIGTVYNKALVANSGGRPWKLQYDFNTTQVGEITGWGLGAPLPSPTRMSQVIVTNSRVYVLGGYWGSTFLSTVYTAVINSDGTLGVWTTASNLPVAIRSHQAIITTNRVYVIGGFNSNGNAVASVYTSSINSDGTLSNWTSVTSLPVALYDFQIMVTSNRVYVMGGIFDNSTVSSAVHTAVVNSNGTLGTWTQVVSLPASVYGSQVIMTNNRVYLMGGHTNGVLSSVVHTALIATDGTLGTWSTSTPIPTILNRFQAVVTNGQVYIIGGYNNTSTATVYSAVVNLDGTLGTWMARTSLPVTCQDSQAIVTSSRIMLLTGQFDGAEVATVYTAPFLGGINNYAGYIALVPASVTEFTLPDFSPLEEANIKYFIKI